MTYHCLRTKEGERFFREAGVGAPVVLLHCSAGSSAAWLPVMNDLCRDYRLLAPDLLGYGRGAPWPAGKVLLQDEELGFVDALLALAGRPVHLVGHSYGGAIALRAAIRFAPQIASLTLIEPVAFHLLRQAGAPDGWGEIAALAERHVGLAVEGRDAAAADMFLSYWMGAQAAQLPEASRDTAVRTAAKVAAEWQLMFAMADDRDALARLDLPTLLVCGGCTRTPARRVIEELRTILPAVTCHELPKAGHMSPMTHPADIAHLIRQHVGRIACAA